MSMNKQFYLLVEKSVSPVGGCTVYSVEHYTNAIATQNYPKIYCQIVGGWNSATKFSKEFWCPISKGTVCGTPNIKQPNRAVCTRISVSILHNKHKHIPNIFAEMSNKEERRRHEKRH